jgi:outer membrane lipoprotein-sorting protein
MRYLASLTIAAGLILPAPAALAAIDAKEVAALMAYIDQSMFPRLATATIKVTSYKQDKVLKEVAVDFTMKADNALLGIVAPATDKGKYILRSGKNMWMYFSDIKRSIRLSAKDSFLGTDANNYDMMQINLLADYTIAGFSETTLNGEPVVKVELAAKRGTDGYSRITSWISPASRRLLQNDCYSISGAQIKTIQYRNPVAVGDYRVPGEAHIVNFVDKDRSTTMRFTNVQPKTDIKSSVFTVGYLEALN